MKFSGSGSRRMFCSNGTMHVVCTGFLCVVYIGLLSAEFSTACEYRIGMIWKPLCLLSTPEGLATINYQLT